MAHEKGKWERALATMLPMYGLPVPTLFHLFAKEQMGRKWEADLSWPDFKMAIEIDGGTFATQKVSQKNLPPGGDVDGSTFASLMAGTGARGGRHNSGTGFLADMEKRNAYAVLGWRVIHVTPGMIENGSAATLARFWWIQLWPEFVVPGVVGGGEFVWPTHVP